MRFAVSFVVGLIVLVTEVLMFIQHLGGIDRVPEFLKALIVMSLIGVIIAGAGLMIALYSSAAAGLLAYWILGLFAGDRE